MIQSYLNDYLQRNASTPIAWSKVFGGYGVAAGAVAGFAQQGLVGALPGGFVGGTIGALVGLLIGVIVRLGLRLAKHRLDRLVRRPDLWGIPFFCPASAWRTVPTGPWRLRDCFSPPTLCPSCGHALRVFLPPCPECGFLARSGYRWPFESKQVLWGGYTCASCGCHYDKWGRPTTT
jgi:hypothetical protein